MIFFDTQNSTDLRGASSGSLSITTAANFNAGLFIHVFAGTPTALSVQVDSVAATQIATISDGGTNHAYVYFKAGLSPGSHSISVSGASNFYFLGATSYWGVDSVNVGNVTATNAFSITANPVTLSLTPTIANGWTGISVFTIPSSSWLATFANSTNSTGRLISNSNPGTPYNQDDYIGDSNGVAPTSSFSMSVANTPNSGSGTRILGIMYTITPSADDTSARYWVGGSGTWDTTTMTNWATSSGGSGGVPPPISTTVDVLFDGNSGGGTVTLGNSYTGIKIDTTGFTGTLAQSTYSLTLSSDFILGSSVTHSGSGANTIGGNLTFGTSTVESYTGTISLSGNLSLGSSMTYSNTSALTFAATSSGKTITTSSITIPCPLVFNGSGGVWTLQDNLTSSSSITLTSGTLVTGNKNITLTGTGTVWNAGGGSFTSGTGTITINNASSSSKTFAGGGLTYYNLYLTGAGTGTFIIQGSNTFNDFKCDTPPHTIQFTAGTTQTLNTFTVSGTAGNLMTLQSTSNGSPWYLKKSPTGQVSCDYLSLQDSYVS